MVHRRVAKRAEVFHKEIFSQRTLRLCGEILLREIHCFDRAIAGPLTKQRITANMNNTTARRS